LNVIAIRGERVALVRSRFSGRDQRPEAFNIESLCIAEVDGDGLISEHIMFDPDDLDAALAELDARYLAGEAAAYGQAWSVIAGGYAAFNRRELSATTPEWSDVDHRRGAAFAPGDMVAYLQAAWDDSPDTKIYIAAVHRLSNIGGVVTHVAHGISQEGFDAEWRDVHLLTVEGEMPSGSELFDAADLDAALARFDELSRPAPGPENAASRVTKRVVACLAAGDATAIADDVFAADYCLDDRRSVVNTGVRQGRGLAVEDLTSAADVGFTNVSSTVVATRGTGLALSRARWSAGDERPDAFIMDMLHVVEVNADERTTACITFDVDDLDAALAELDARYLAGEAAPCAPVWSVIMNGHAALNRRERPPVAPDCISVDHRRGAAFAPGELVAYLDAGIELDQSTLTYTAVVHRLSDLGAVCTSAGHGVSREGFDAEWRDVDLLSVEGGLITRAEIFDEADLDVALARFDELNRPATRLENAATKVEARFQEYFAARDWEAMGEILADDIFADDRRRVVNAGPRHGRDAKIADMRATADLGTKNGTSTVIAIRGQCLALVRIRLSGRDQRPDAFHTEMLGIAEIDADNRMAARVLFDVDDDDAAFAELDARYLAGEAAPYAPVWSLISRSSAAFNRHVMPPTAPDWVNIDHRKVTAFAPGDMTPHMRARSDVAPDIKFYIEEVHRLSNLGAVFTQPARGSSHEGFEAEWRDIILLSVEGDQFNRCEVFDEADLDAALARFDAVTRPAQRLENAASRVVDRLLALFGARDWDVMAEMIRGDVSIDDRRRAVNGGVRHGRDAEIEDLRAAADVGFTHLTSTVIATRGALLILNLLRGSGHDPDAIQSDALQITAIDADERLLAVVVFDLDDIDAAFEELEARYIAGEAAAHAHTWSMIARGFAALNRHEVPPTTPDLVNVDHRRVTAYAPGELISYVRAGWDLGQNIRTYPEVVHRLSNHGAVVTHAAHGISQEGFEAEWRGVDLLTVDRDMVNRCETFDEADLDAALARFDELSGPAPRLGNTASRTYDRFNTHFAARDWDAMARMLTDDSLVDDRRRVVGAGVRRGRNATMAAWRAIAEMRVTNIASVAIATRGTRLALCRAWAGTTGPEAFDVEALQIVDIDAGERMEAVVSFDLDDIDAAFAELDARYFAGEAAECADTWSLIAEAYASIRRHALPSAMSGCVNIDHRGAAAFAPGELVAWIRAGLEIDQTFGPHMEVVHRLTNRGAVITYAAQGTSPEGFDAEWREISLSIVEGDMIIRCELFDEADLDAALARFDELSVHAPRLGNTACRVGERYLKQFAARDWNAMADMLADDFSSNDRRRVVGAGVRLGRDAEIASMRAVSDVGLTNARQTCFAERGARLALSRIRLSGPNHGQDAVVIDALGVVEINADNRIAATVVFDLDDVDAAFDELDARYLAGEANAHAHTWSVMTGALAAVNRHELPEVAPDWVNIDHRRAVAFAPGDMTAYMHATWDHGPDGRAYIEVVHRLSNLGAIVTQVGHEISPQGFEAEWRMLNLGTIEGDQINRIELFDETDLDAALAKFDELRRSTRRLENAAGRAYERFWTYVAARDWNAMAQILADDYSADDRRRTVNAGVLHGRDAEIANLRAIAELGVTDVTPAVIAIRGERLALDRVRISDGDGPDAFYTEVLGVIEIDADKRMVGFVMFDLDDIGAALEVLDARYLAGEAAALAHTWSVIARGYAAANRGELAATAPDVVNIDHRQLAMIEAGALVPYLRDTFDELANLSTYPEAVHRLTDLGAVITHVGAGTSKEGFDAEWRMINLIVLDGEVIGRSEVFDEADLDAALARFDELNQPAP
jgi:hypothetical protein